jgi:RNA polymerase sigma-70 factor, ECF subfamily
LECGVKEMAMSLTPWQTSCQNPRRMVEQPEALEGKLSVRLETALVDAEPALRRIAERLCKNSVDSRDLVQDTFERAMRQGIPPEVRSTAAWLTTIMHNLFIDHCRADARHPSTELLENNYANVTQLEPDASEPAWTRITIQDIRDALDQIEQVYRDVYKLHTFEHLSYEQIAQQLSIQRITVGTRLTRARKSLRAVLVKRFGLEETP